MSDDIETLRGFINFAHRDRNSPEFLELSLTAYDALKSVSAERDSLRKALDDRYAADQRAAKAIFAATGRTSGFPSVTEVVAYYIAEVERLEKERDWFKGLVNSHDLLKDNADLRAKFERAKEALKPFSGIAVYMSRSHLNNDDDGAMVRAKLSDCNRAKAILAELSADAPAQQGPALLSARLSGARFI